MTSRSSSRQPITCNPPRPWIFLLRLRHPKLRLCVPRRGGPATFMFRLRNMFVVLSGEWEVTASDGESRRFAVSNALLVEDTTGKGHSSRVMSDTESVAVVVA